MKKLMRIIIKLWIIKLLANKGGEKVRYYLVNNKGENIADSGDKKYLELLMHDIFTDEEIARDEIEIIEGN